ncbi:MAG: hypothetical protein ABI726_08875, partial [bacterium]
MYERGIEGPAGAFALLADQGELEGSRASGSRRLAALMLTLGVAVSAPMFWASTAFGDQADQPVAIHAKGNSGPGDGDGVDDDDDDDDTGPGGATDRPGGDTSANGADTAGTTAGTGASNTQNGTDEGGVTDRPGGDTSANGADTAGT